MTELFKIITLGCKVNQYESAYLKEALTRAGWRQAASGEHCDIAIINTCIVTQRASHQSRQAIRKAIRESPDGIIAAVGCYPQVYPDELSGIRGLGFIAGNTEKGQLIDALINAAGSKKQTLNFRAFEPNMPFEFLPIKMFSGRTRAFLKIQDGCQSFCSYCIVPFARGPVRSLALEKVIDMLWRLAGQGYKEVVLTGIHLGKYGIDLKGGITLNHLLRIIGRERFPVRIRLSSIEPNEINDEIIDMAIDEEWLCSHFHIPLQSGDDRILKKMNRGYTSLEFMKLIESIHTKIPLAGIGIDVMPGFPGEDSVAHDNTCSMLSDLPVSYLHVFPFSPRPGTPASTFEGRIDPDVIKRRSLELRKLGQRKRSEFYNGCLNKDFLVLAEGWHSKEEKIMNGKSENYLPVLFPSSQDSIGRLIPVRMAKVENDMLIGYPL